MEDRIIGVSLERVFPNDQSNPPLDSVFTFVEAGEKRLRFTTILASAHWLPASTSKVSKDRTEELLIQPIQEEACLLLLLVNFRKREFRSFSKYLLVQS